MKHLLIILSLLLLSSPVIGQETGVLYLYESSSGFVLKNFGDGKVQPKYKGEITNGKPNGFGVLTYPYGEKSVVGEWKEGKEWNTKHTKKDGTLIGKFENGKWKDKVKGVLYRRWVDGEFRWYKIGDEKKDSKYVGEIKNRKPNGQGTFTFGKGEWEGDEYIGKWRDGEYEGQGTFTWTNGEKYIGEWRDGKRDGQGTYTFPDGEKYIGEWRDGKRDGQGTNTYPSGDKYVGEYKDGKRDGQGTFTYPSGGNYEGEWKDGEYEGQGIKTWSNGDKYIGEFKDGEINGQGTYTYSSGSKEVGENKNGIIWNGTRYDKNGKIIYKVVSGKWIKQ